jgi:acyl carrier protein
MNDQEIIAHINTILIEEFEIEKESIVASASVLEVLKIDSLDLIDLVVLMENKFDFKVRTGDLAGMKILQDFYDYIIQRVHEKE